jgi:UDP-glucose 4-epimerase
VVTLAGSAAPLGRVLVTGGAGFIGSHLVEALVDRGDSVVVLDNLATGQLSNLEAVLGHRNVHFVQGTVLDALMVDELAYDCDVIVHLAAATGVPQIVQQPSHTFTHNLRGSQTVIEAAQRYKRRLLLASTSEVYGKNTDVPLAEDANRILGSPIIARWAYSIGKAVEEILAYAYHRERGLEVTVVRFFNVVGPRQNLGYGTVVPRLVRQAVAGEPLTVFGDGRQTRCFCHVRDAVDALVGLAANAGAAGEAYNVGAQQEISVRDLAQRVLDLSGVPSGNGAGAGIRLIPYDTAYGPGFEDMQRRVPDLRKITALTGWEPTTTLDEILAEALAEAAAERKVRTELAMLAAEHE